MQDQVKDLSIIVVNYQSWLCLKECLESIHAIKPKIKLEVIVVDNNSKDGHYDEFSMQFSEVKFIKNISNYGFSHGCNLGAKHATGEYLLFLNPDTMLEDNASIETMLNFAKNNPLVGITSCKKINNKGVSETEIKFTNPWMNIGFINTIYRIIFQSYLKKEFDEKLSTWYPDMVSGAVVLISKKMFQKVDGWNQEDYWMYFEDTELCSKVSLAGGRIALLRDVRIRHTHGGSTRVNSRTAALTKSEVITSKHVYMHAHSQGLSRLALHSIIVISTLISLLGKNLILLPVFWKPKYRISAIVLGKVTWYYVSAIFRQTWKSERLAK